MAASISAYVDYSHSAVTVTTASGAASAANDVRRYLLLVNDSDTDMYVNVGATAVANEGIRINANGGSFEMSENNRNLSRAAVNVIHGGSGNKTLLVTEA